MSKAEAFAVIGRGNLAYGGAMARALAIHSWRNGPADWQRVLALRTLGYKAARNLVNAYGLAEVKRLAA